jgi:cytochrome P450
VKEPKLLKDSIPAVLAAEYGADSDVVTDNLIMVIFAGFETSTGLSIRLLYELARHPEALKKVGQKDASFICRRTCCQIKPAVTCIHTHQAAWVPSLHLLARICNSVCTLHL